MKDVIEKERKPKKKPARRKYIIAAVIIFLCIFSGLIYRAITWTPEDSESTRRSEAIIRIAAAKKLHKDPNDITDEDFAQFEFVLFSSKSTATATTDLKSLAVQVKELSDIKYLEKFTNLQKLSFVDISSKLPKWMVILEKIGYKNSNRKISIDVSPLKNLANFKQLNIDDTPIFNLISLKELKNLEKLNLTYTKVSDTRQMSGMKSLKELVLYSNPLSDLNPIKDLVNLVVLDLRKTSVSNLKSVQNLINLKSLLIGETEVSDIEPLQNLKYLEILDITETPVSDLKPLMGLKRLKILCLNKTPVSNLDPVKELKNLNVLSIADCENITDKQIEDLQKAIPDLEVKIRKMEISK